MKRLENKVAIITGGNSGIGAAAAMMFAKEGASVVISARRANQLEEVAEKIKAEGGKVLAVPTDISKVEEVQNLVEQTVKTFGKVDILVNNAGVLDQGLRPIDKVHDEDMDFIIDVNTKGTMYCIREVSKLMLEQESGSIVNIASVAGVKGNGGAAYVASKSAIVGITTHTALRSASKHVRCNAVCPGTVLTPMTGNLDHSALDMELMGAMSTHADMKVPPCTAEDVANIALFLASDESRAITGQTIVSDFGSTL